MTPIEELLARPKAERRLGAFHVDPEKILGEGGFAPVFLADEIHDGAFFRKVALKVFAIASGEEGTSQRKKILREAGALCKVKDKNVVKYYSIARDDALGLVGIAMEYVEGASLAERIKSGPLGAAEAARVAASVARALSAIHDRNLVHRDIKPGNVIDANGVHTLIDFGIAATERAPAAEVAEPVLRGALADFVLEGMTAAYAGSGARRTRQATLATIGVVGTMGYIDPACLKTGATAERAADLYALGVTLYECLTGKLPSRAAADLSETPTAAVEAVLVGDAAPPPVRAVAPDTPEALAAIVDRLVDPDPDKRFATAASVLDALDQRDKKREAPVLPAAPTLVTPPPKPVLLASPEEVARDLAATKQRLARSTRRRILVGVLAVLVLAGGGIAGWMAINAAERAAERRRNDDWASLLVCLLGEPKADGLAAMDRFREIAAAFTSTDAPKAYLGRCRPLATRIDEELPQNPKTEKFKEVLSFFVKPRESVTSDEIRPKLGALVETANASHFRIAIGTPSPDATPPTWITPKFQPGAFEDLPKVPFGSFSSRTRAFPRAGEAWSGDCLYSKEGVKCWEDGKPPPVMEPIELDRPFASQVWEHVIAFDRRAKAIVDVARPEVPIAPIDPSVANAGALAGCKSTKTTWAIVASKPNEVVVVSWTDGAVGTRTVEASVPLTVGCDDAGLWFDPNRKDDPARAWALCDAGARDCRFEKARPEPKLPEGAKRLAGCGDGRGDWIAFSHREMLYAGRATDPKPVVAPRRDYVVEMVCGPGVAFAIVHIGDTRYALDVTAL